MKKLIIGLLLYTGLHFVPQHTNAQQVSVSFQLFYDELSPHGMWVNNASYGYVWVPNAGAGFSPYASEGYWVYTDWGWTWVSYYNWGWAPFHYGRWYYDPFYGYAWIPGNDWGPAWVSWRRCNGYYGWVPLGPGISYGATYASYNPPAERWVFVRESDFGSRNTTYVDRSTNVTIINNSTVINNTVVNKSRNETYIAGPDRAEVQKFTGRNVQPLAVVDNSKREVKVSNDKLQVYRPKVENVSGERKPAPAKVHNADEVKPVIEKRGTGAPNQNLNREKKDLQPVQKAPVSDDKKLNRVQPGNDRREVQPQQRIAPNEPNERAPQNNMRQVQPREVKPQIRNEQPMQRINPNEEPGMRNDVQPVQPRNVNPQIREEQSPQRVNPNQENRMRNNELRQNQHRNVQPVQPRMERQQPMQRVQPVNPNPQQGRPNVNPGGGQRVPLQGPRKHK